MKRGVMSRLNTGIMAIALVLTQVLMPAQSAFADNDKVKPDTSNNGTLKVHEKGTVAADESNDPKVCIFNFEAFGLDGNQTGNITIETQSGSPVIAPKTSTLTTDANGDGESTYINDVDSSVSLANGHYKATLDNKFGTDPGNKAKSKVFKVDCPVIVTPTPATPVAPTLVDACETVQDLYTIPSIEGVEYLVGETVITAGTYPAAALSVTVTARALDGYVISGTSSFTLSFTNKKCPVVPVCTAKDNLYDSEWMYDGDTFPMTGNGGNYNFEPTGLYLSTPATEDDVYGLIDAGMTPMAQVENMSYDVLRLSQSAGYASTLPAYILLVDTKGNGNAGDMKYLFYEPYNNDAARAANEGEFQTWDAYMDGNAVWYMSGTGQKLEKWSTLAGMFPDAEVLAYGFNQGTYNAETYSAIQNVTFDCATTVFTNEDEGGNGGGGDTPTVPTTPVAPTVPTTPVVPATPTKVAGGQGNVLPEELPMTGQNGSILSTWIALLAAILTYGSVYYLQPKKRFEQ